MIVDTSAAVAITFAEDEADALIAAMSGARRVRMSVASVLEFSIVTRAFGREVVDRFLRELAVEVLPLDAAQLEWARVGFERFGRGSGSPARLNFGDCLVYGAAKALDEPLLYKGDDFPHTDVRSALP